MNGITTQPLIDLETQIQLRDATPKVMQVPWDMAQQVLDALYEVAETAKSHRDRDGKVYWDTSLKEIAAVGKLPKEVTNIRIGRACRQMGLVMWRTGDGWRVIFGLSQLRILGDYFKRQGHVNER